MATLDKAQAGMTGVAQLSGATAHVSQSNFARSWRRLRKHRMAVLGGILLLMIALFVIVGSLVYTPAQSNKIIDSLRNNETPSAEHIFGLDENGRDIFIRTIYGGQISIFIGISAALLEILLGTAIGVTAGYFSGKNIIDSVLMRFVEIMLSLPQLMLVLLAVKVAVAHGLNGNITILGREYSAVMFLIIVMIAATSWMSVARIVRSTVLSVREQEYVTAARSVGVSEWRIVLKHILPNCLSPIIVSATLGVGAAILLEAYLGYLGLGVPAPAATWGSMLNAAHDNGPYYWNLWFFPGMFIVLTVLGVNFLGDGLRDALDPYAVNG